MNYLIYKITNTVNNKIYIGCHKTKEVDDGYMGSGKILKRAIEKYGIDNFHKEILHNFDKSEDMFFMESELVNEDFVKDQTNYNLKEGGIGGFDYINANKLQDPTTWSVDARKRHQQNGKVQGTKQVEGKDGMFGWTTEERQANNINARNVMLKKYPNGPFFKKHHTDETKNAISKKAKDRLKDPTKNSQFGTMWITNEIESKKIKKDQPIPDGFRKGRKMK